ncbi:MAG TPA: hypothetical protein VHU84_08295, partial [Lacipirellulaceae bacterium]|nr:hypothetical protein [Lacipirellulaceae bacterium]
LSPPAVKIGFPAGLAHNNDGKKTSHGKWAALQWKNPPSQTSTTWGERAPIQLSSPPMRGSRSTSSIIIVGIRNRRFPTPARTVHRLRWYTADVLIEHPPDTQ